MTVNGGVGRWFMILAEIVWKLEVSHKKKKYSFLHCGLSQTMCHTYPIYRDQARRSCWRTSNLIRMGLETQSELVSHHGIPADGPQPYIRQIWAAEAQPSLRSMRLDGLTRHLGFDTRSSPCAPPLS